MECPLSQDARRHRHPPLLRPLTVLLGVLGSVLPAWRDASAAADASATQRSVWQDDAVFQKASHNLVEWLSRGEGGVRLAARWRAAVAGAPRAARLAEPCRRLAAEADVRLASLLRAIDDQPPGWVATLGPAEPSFRLAVADALAADERWDACLAWTEGVDEAEVFAPALLNYLRAVAWRQTVDDEEALSSLAKLPESEDGGPSLGAARQWVVTALHRELKEKSQPLPKVARRMQDVERRLAQSDSGEATQERQQKILDDLDKLIEDLEKQRQQQQQMAAQQPGGGAEPGDPAEESRPSELKGPGEIDRKRLVAGDAWGSLPPAERERLTQAITRDFPPHYRSLVEDYFRTLASEADAAEAGTPPLPADAP